MIHDFGGIELYRIVRRKGDKLRHILWAETARRRSGSALGKARESASQFWASSAEERYANKRRTRQSGSLHFEESHEYPADSACIVEAPSARARKEHRVRVCVAHSPGLDVAPVGAPPSCARATLAAPNTASKAAAMWRVADRMLAERVRVRSLELIPGRSGRLQGLAGIQQ